MMERLFGISGPDLSTSKREEFDLSGTKVSFLAPEYSYNQWSGEEEVNLKRTFDLSNSTIYWSEQEEFKHRYISGEQSSADGFSLFHTVWSFQNGFFLREHTGQDRLFNRDSVELNVAILHCAEFSSVFIGKPLQNAITHELNTYWGPTSRLGNSDFLGCRYIAPLNWQVLHVNGVPCISFLLQEFGHLGCGMYEWYLPVSSTHVLAFSFKNALEPSKQLALKLYQLMYGIVSSCQFEYSDEVKKQIAEAETLDQESISEYVEPFPWHSQEVLDEAVKNNPFPRGN